MLENKKGKEEYIVLTIGLLYLYFISKRGGDTRYIFSILLMATTIIQSFKSGYEKYFFYKKELFSSGLYIILLFITYILTENKVDRLSTILGMTIYTVLFMSICLNLKINEKFYKFFIPLLIVISSESIFRGLKDVYLNYKILSWYRISGGTYTTVYAAELGMYTLIGIIAVLYYKEIYKKIFACIYIIINLFLIVSTQSRTTMFSVPLTLIILFVIWNRKKGIILSIIILICSIVLFKSFPDLKPIKRLSTLTSIEKIKETPRYPIFLDGIKAGKNNILKGEGFYKHKEMTLLTKKAGYQPHYHNIFIETFATQGLFVLLSYISFLTIIFIRLLKNYFNEKEQLKKAIKLLGIAVFIFMMFYGLSEPFFYFGKINQLLFTILALSFIVDKTYLKEERRDVL